MRRYHIILALGLSTALVAGRAPATTLDVAIETALAKSPESGAARADYLISRARVAIAVARARPQLNFQASAMHDFDDDPLTPRVRDESTLRLTLPLYSGGRIRNVITAARLRALAASDDLAARTDDLRISVGESYDRVLDAEDGVRIARDEADALDRQLAIVGSEREQGLATRTDEAQAAARLALLRAQREGLIGQSDAAYASYRQVVGADPDGLVAPDVPVIRGDLQALTDAALHYSPSLRAMQARIDAATRDVVATRGQGRPTLSFVASVSYGNTDMLLAETQRFPQRLFAQAGITLTIPLYSGGQLAAQTARANAALQATEAEAEVERRRLVAEVRTGYTAYQGALDRIAATDSAGDAARRALAGVRIEHEAGTRTALDLLNAQREAFEDARAAARARRQAHIEAIALLVRTGAYPAARTYRPTASVAASSATAMILTGRVDFDLGKLPGSVATAPATLS